MVEIIDTVYEGFACIIGGTLLTLSVVSLLNPNANSFEVFQRENKPAVMRMYKLGSDGIYVADLERNDFSDTHFIKLDNYLKDIGNVADRNIKKAELEKVVRWYK